VLTGTAAVVAGLGGCARGGDTTAESGGTDPTATGAVTASGDADLDLREANVVAVVGLRPTARGAWLLAVVVEEKSEGYRFDVTLHHDDGGEDGYANWWQVETRGGERLGRRELAHPHGTREFTRSATVAVPEDTICVVVRGHDETHGYGGRAVLVNVETGATTAVRQGSDRVSMAGRACP
jgi:hypothetical protein